MGEKIGNMRALSSLLFFALVAVCTASVETRDKVRLIIQGYGNPKNVGRQVMGSSIVNNVHHLKARWRDNLFRMKADYKRRTGRELILATDQEGGKVSRLRWAVPRLQVLL